MTSLRPIPAVELEAQGLLGSGSFGEVCRSSWRGKAVAVKVTRQTLLDHEVTHFLGANSIHLAGLLGWGSVW
jgi:hypothetical protein